MFKRFMQSFVAIRMCLLTVLFFMYAINITNSEYVAIEICL